MNNELFDEVAESLNILGVSIEKNIQNLRKTYRTKWKKLFKEFASQDNDLLMKVNAAYELLESKKDEDLNQFVKEYLKKTDLNQTKKFATAKNRIKNISNVKVKAEEKRKALEKAKAEEKRKALEKAKAEEKRIALEKAKAEEKRKALEKAKAELNQNPNDGCVPGLLLLLLGFLGIILFSFGILATYEESEEKNSKQNNLLNNAKNQNKQFNENFRNNIQNQNKLNYNSSPFSIVEELSVINFYENKRTNRDFIKLKKERNPYIDGYKRSHFYDSSGLKWNVTANCKNTEPSLTIQRGSFVEKTDFTKSREDPIKLLSSRNVLIYTSLCKSLDKFDLAWWARDRRRYKGKCINKVYATKMGNAYTCRKLGFWD